jgi:O-antigen/teichoic acid export membrane protein
MEINSLNNAAQVNKKKMGRGVIYLTSSRMAFAFSGFVLHVGLARILGVEEYGIYGVIMAMMGIINILYQPGIYTAVAKYTSEKIEIADLILTTGLRLQTCLSIFSALILFLCAPLIAQLLKDSSLTSYIRLASLITIPSGLNLIYLASLNGARRFGKQAFSIIVHSAVKVLIIFAIILFGFKVKGVILGLIVSTVIATFIARHFCQYDKRDEVFEIKRLLAFAVSVFIYVFCVSSITNVDLLFVKSLLESNEATGLYTSAANVAKVPFIFFSSFATVLLPSVSQAIARNDMELFRKYVCQTLRYVLLGLVPLIFVLSSSAKEVIEILYSANFSGAVMPLSILFFGISFSVVLSLLSTVVIGSGSPRVAMIFSLILLPLDIVLNLLLIPKYGLVGAATATTLTFFAGSVMLGIYIYSRFNTLMNVSSSLKILFASTVIYALSVILPFQGLWIILEFILLFILYAFILLIVKEISKEDIKIFRDIFTPPRLF